MKIAGMRRFAKNPRLQADSVPDITQPFEDAVLDLSRSVTFANGKLRGAHVLNALIHEFNGMNRDERKAVVEAAVAKLELLLAESDEERGAAEKRLEESKPDPTKVIRVRVHEKQPKAKEQAKGKGKRSNERSGEDVGTEEDGTPTLAR